VAPTTAHERASHALCFAAHFQFTLSAAAAESSARGRGKRGRSDLDPRSRTVVLVSALNCDSDYSTRFLSVVGQLAVW